MYMTWYFDVLTWLRAVGVLNVDSR